MYEFIVLFGAGIFAGLVNSMAGGGALILYPILFSLGLSPIMTNAVIATSIWPGSLSSAYGYRKYIKKIPPYYFLLLIPCLIGSLIGASILKSTPDHYFKSIVPWLVLMAVVLLSLQPRIHNFLKTRHKKSKKHLSTNLLIIAVAILFTSIYGGYFGAGYGIIMLALLGFTKLTDIHQMNGFKNLAGVCICLVASIYFIYYGLVSWHFLPPILIGTVIGGYLGASYSHILPANIVRRIIIVIGIIVSAVLFVK